MRFKTAIEMLRALSIREDRRTYSYLPEEDIQASQIKADVYREIAQILEAAMEDEDEAE